MPWIFCCRLRCKNMVAATSLHCNTCKNTVQLGMPLWRRPQLKLTKLHLLRRNSRATRQNKFCQFAYDAVASLFCRDGHTWEGSRFNPGGGASPLIGVRVPICLDCVVATTWITCCCNESWTNCCRRCCKNMVAATCRDGHTWEGSRFNPARGAPPRLSVCVYPSVWTVWRHITSSKWRQRGSHAVATISWTSCCRKRSKNMVAATKSSSHHMQR